MPDSRTAGCEAPLSVVSHKCLLDRGTWWGWTGVRFEWVRFDCVFVARHLSPMSHDNTKRPRQDSNLRTRLRRPMLYPLSYEGEGLQSTCSTRQIGRAS